MRLWELSSSGRAHNLAFRSWGLGPKCGLTLIPVSPHPIQAGPPHGPTGSCFQRSTHTDSGRPRCRAWQSVPRPRGAAERLGKVPGSRGRLWSKSSGQPAQDSGDLWSPRLLAHVPQGGVRPGQQQKRRAWQRPLGGSRGLRAGAHGARPRQAASGTLGAWSREQALPTPRTAAPAASVCHRPTPPRTPGLDLLWALSPLGGAYWTHASHHARGCPRAWGPGVT